MPDLGNFFNVLRYMKPTQLIGRLRKDKILARVPAEQEYKRLTDGGLRLFIDALDNDPGYRARFKTEELFSDTITLLNETFSVDMSDWTADGSSNLWMFNLHYFEYCVALAVKFRETLDKMYYEKFRQLVMSWIENCPPDNRIAWHPYTISRRLPNWLICAELFGTTFTDDDVFFGDLYNSVYMQYRSLAMRMETWQMGDHYLENLKTVLLCSILYEDDKTYARTLRKLTRELEEEILPDGVHFERSLMIHKTALEGLIRTEHVLMDKKPADAPLLIPYIQAMLSAAASLEQGMGHTPLFNDSADNVAKSIDSLVRAALRIGVEPEYTENFEDSGYYKLYQGTTALMFDAGPLGPYFISDHGHCDCLSFEMSIGGTPLFVNSGTYKTDSEDRSYFRSTAAHNTAVPKDCEQAELWGRYGVSRRFSGLRCTRTYDGLKASCVLYDGTDHERTITLRDGEFTVMDNILNTSVHQIHSYLHIAPGCDVIKRGGKYMILRGGIDICTLTPKGCDCVLHTSGQLTSYAREMGRLEHTSCLEFLWEKDGAPHGYTCELRTDAASVPEI